MRPMLAPCKVHSMETSASVAPLEGRWPVNTTPRGVRSRPSVGEAQLRSLAIPSFPLKGEKQITFSPASAPFRPMDS